MYSRVPSQAAMSELFSALVRPFVQAVADLAHCNPFLPERVALERAALGDEFDDRYAAWNVQGKMENNPNQTRLLHRADAELRAAHARLAAQRGEPEAGDLQLYEDLVLCVAFHRLAPALDRLIARRNESDAVPARTAYHSLTEFARPLLTFGEHSSSLADQLPHVLAAFFQIRRAFANIYSFVVGTSSKTTQLRAAIWQSIFSHDLRRYRRTLFDKMGDYTTLVTGPSGTGKELVAQAVGRSRYIPFDPKTERFHVDFAAAFATINLSAMSPTLIESELFGHRKGAYTGAAADRVGWLEACTAYGSVFLDEIGELDPAIQVKLLRVLQTRTFSRLGETQEREFGGKLIAATNRDLAEAMQTGGFRQDLYYRLCGDVVRVPSLRERIADDPRELRHLILHIAERLVGEEAPQLATEVEELVERHLGADYAWPGNIRELEQCIRNIVIRREYRAPMTATTPAPRDPCEEIAAAVRRGATADEVLRMQCTWAYQTCGSYEAAAQRLDLDRRTVKAKVDAELLERWRRGN